MGRIGPPPTPAPPDAEPRALPEAAGAVTARTLASSWEGLYCQAMAVVSDEDYCADMVRAADRDRWLAAALATAGGRPALVALYCLNAETARIPDQVSEPILGRIRLEWWREAVSAARTGDAPDHPALRALSPFLASGALSESDLDAFLDARAAELEAPGPATLPAFEARCRAIGGGLARMALGLLAVTGPEALAAAEAAGTAHAMTGRLRNAAWDASRGRVTLPDDLLDRHGVDRESILMGAPGPELAAAARQIAARAGELLAAARAERRTVPRKALPVLAIARITDAELGRLGHTGFDLFSGRTEPWPLARPLAVLTGALTGRY